MTACVPLCVPAAVRTHAIYSRGILIEPSDHCSGPQQQEQARQRADCCAVQCAIGSLWPRRVCARITFLRETMFCLLPEAAAQSHNSSSMRARGRVACESKKRSAATQHKVLGTPVPARAASLPALGPNTRASRQLLRSDADSSETATARTRARPVCGHSSHDLCPPLHPANSALSSAPLAFLFTCDSRFCIECPLSRICASQPYIE